MLGCIRDHGVGGLRGMERSGEGIRKELRIRNEKWGEVAPIFLPLSAQRLAQSARRLKNTAGMWKVQSDSILGRLRK